MRHAGLSTGGCGYKTRSSSTGPCTHRWNLPTFGYGDVWTWTAIDAESKLIPSWLVGERSSPDCYAFLADLRSRLVPGHRFQLTSDGLGLYPPIVDALWRDGIDYAQIVKEGRGKVTPAMAAGVEDYPWSLTQLAELLEHEEA